MSGTARVTGVPWQVKRWGNIAKCSQFRAHHRDVLRSVKKHRQSRISAAVPSPSNYVSTSHDQPCAAKTRGKVAALCSLETGRNWQQTNTHMHNDNNAPLLPWNNPRPVVLGYTRPAFNSFVPLKADATPSLTDSASPPIFKVSDQAGIKRGILIKVFPHECALEHHTRIYMHLYPQHIGVTCIISSIPPTWPVIN